MHFKVQDVIPAGLAKRFLRRDVHINNGWFVEVRVLDYDVIEGSTQSTGMPVFK